MAALHHSLPTLNCSIGRVKQDTNKIIVPGSVFTSDAVFGTSLWTQWKQLITCACKIKANYPFSNFKSHNGLHRTPQCF